MVVPVARDLNKPPIALLGTDAVTEAVVDGPAGTPPGGTTGGTLAVSEGVVDCDPKRPPDCDAPSSPNGEGLLEASDCPAGFGGVATVSIGNGDGNEPELDANFLDAW